MFSVTFLHPLNTSENRWYKKVMLEITRLKSPKKSKTGFVTRLSVLGMAMYCYWLFVENIFSFPDLKTLNNNWEQYEQNLYKKCTASNKQDFLKTQYENYTFLN